MKAIILKDGYAVGLGPYQTFEPTPKMLQIVEKVNGHVRVVQRFRASSITHCSKDLVNYEPYRHQDLSQYWPS